MPKLDWVGKQYVVNHVDDVPFRLLERVPGSSMSEDSGNMIVHGDNLEALKALMPYYRERVKLVFIDPPYNTGNEDWVYNDRMNAPKIKEWLGRVVGGEGEDLSRHDKWLCMMYPRLTLLRDLLAQNGSLWMTIDDNEVHYAKAMMDEIFGRDNFIASVIWQKVYAPKSSAKYFSDDHDYVLVYAKNAEVWRPNLLPRTEKQDKIYRNRDNDRRGPWRPDNLTARNPYSLGIYPVTTPSGRVISGPPKGRYWAISEEKLKELDADKRIWWGEKGNNVPALKRFLSEVKQGVLAEGASDLIRWLLKKIGRYEELADRDLRHYVQKTLGELQKAYSLDALHRMKYQIRDRLQQSLDARYLSWAEVSYETLKERGELVADSDVAYTVPENLELPTSQCITSFRKSVFEYAGKLNAEELEFATKLDGLENLMCWYRNLDKGGFALQGYWRAKFNPDFIAFTKSGKSVVLEYKGEDRVTNEDSIYKERLGSDWAALDPNHRYFKMVTKANMQDTLEEITRL